MSNFKPINNFWFWCQKVLPLVYDDSISYYEVLCKLSDYLNQVINNVNELPDLVNDAVKEYITDEKLQNALKALIVNFDPINVKMPPYGLPAAKGDGNTDDTSALQTLIDYADENNLPLIFPSGVYRVGSLQAHGTHFWGHNAILFKNANTENSLINVTGDFTAYNITFNGNINGQVSPAAIAYLACDNVSFHDCYFTGGLSGIVGNVSNYAEIINCHADNFTEYGIWLSGPGNAFINNYVVDSVANSGALRLMRLDISNSVVYNLYSLASVPVGIELTGNDNDITAHIPNTTTALQDTGLRNNVQISQILSKEIYNAKENQYNTLTENISNNEEITVGGNSTKTILNDSTENVTGSKTFTANSFNVNGDEINMSSGTHTIKATDVILNSTNPLTYKDPTPVNYKQGVVPMKGISSNAQYNLITTNRNYSSPNVLCFGDSLLQGGGWLTGLQSVMDIHTAYNYGISGAGYIRQSDNGSTFMTEVNNAVAGMSADEKNNVDLILVGGSLNDWIIGATADQLKTAVNAFISAVKTNFPNGKIYGFMPCGSMARTVKSFTNTQAVKECYIANGCGWIDWFEYVLYNQSSLVQGDGVHPLTAGFAVQGQWLNAYLNHGDTFNVTETYHITTGGNGFITGRLSGGMVAINMNYRSNTTHNSPVTIASLTESYLPCFPFNNLGTPINGGGEVYLGMALFINQYAIQIGGNVNLSNGSNVICNVCYPAAASNDID